MLVVYSSNQFLFFLFLLIIDDLITQEEMQRGLMQAHIEEVQRFENSRSQNLFSVTKYLAWILRAVM
jgi:hypothetical protein